MLAIAKTLCPYPTFDGQTFDDGLLFEQPKICRKCKENWCQVYFNDDTQQQGEHDICPKGFSVYSVLLPTGQKLLLFGLIDREKNKKCSRDFRKQYRQQRVDFKLIDGWISTLSTMFKKIDELTEKAARDRVASLHDIKSATTLLSANVAAYQNTLPGETDEEKIENAPGEIKAILKSVELLHTRLQMSSIYTNPAAAAYGRKRKTPVYKIFHKMCRLHEELASKNAIRIKMSGNSYNMPLLYDSFETIPLILIDNAVKYSNRNKEIVISVRDVGAGVRVSVKSMGPLLPRSEQPKIFERGYRSPITHSMSSKGSGLGLAIAKIVAEANGFQIEYNGNADLKTSTNEIGANEFSFLIVP